MKIFLCGSLCFIIIFGACAPMTMPQATPAPIFVAPTHTNQPLTMTATLLPPTATPASNLVPTATLGVTLVRQCLQINPKEVALKDVASGVVLLSPNLLDTVTGYRYKLPAQQAKNGYYSEGQASPDGKMFAYTEGIENAQLKIIDRILWVVDARARVISKISFEQEEYVGSLRWLNNERLLLYTAETAKDGTALVVYPFTREQRTISNELPMLLSGGAIPFLQWRVEYSPDLEWVAYYYADHGEQGIIVRDLVTKQNLWQSTGGSIDQPAWSPDGREVAVVNADEGQLYLINRSGQAKPILPDGIKKDAASPSWSSDGKQLAFWNNHSLMVYNRQVDQVVDLCVPGGEDLILPVPLWSPDGQQLVVYQKALVDLQKKICYTQEIPNATIEGWMNSLP